MSATGNLTSNIKLNVDTLNSLIVLTNKYRQDVDKAADEIRLICQQMEDNESLKGGDGDLIRENFKNLSIACKGLYVSTAYIGKALNGRLADTIEKAAKGKNSGGDAASKAAAKVGVYKKK